MMIMRAIIYGHRTSSAWYWRRISEYANDCHWEFLQYGRPNHWYLQREYLEIKT